MRNVISAPQQRGWDTDLAAPFIFIEELPPCFFRRTGKRFFSAVSANTTFWIVVRCQGKFWLRYRNEATREVREHYFQTCSGLNGHHRIAKAIFKLTSDISEHESSGVQCLDLLPFKQAFASVRSVNSLHDGEAPMLSDPQAQALHYLMRCLGLSGHVMIHSGEEFFASDGSRTVSLGQTLPPPLNMLPSIDVALENGRLFDFRETVLWEGEVGHPYNVIDRMKALNALARGGVCAEDVDLLDDYVEQLRTAEAR